MQLRSIPLVVGLALLCPFVSSAQLTQQDIAAILDLHDAERCEVDPPASAMPAMVWDEALASVAMAWANQCTFSANPNRSADYAAAGGSGYVGENIAGFLSGDASPDQLVQLWADERAFWTFEPVSTSNLLATGHYMQMIWANSSTIGCGLATCGNGRFLVCNYAPGGLFFGVTPYVAGSGENQACPEPATAVGLAAGLVALAAWGRRAR